MKAKTKSLHTLPVAIGRNIRDLRRRAGMTLTALADQVGILPGPLGRIERGMNAPSARVIEAAARTFQVSIDTLFAASPEEFRSHREQSLHAPHPVLPEVREIPDRVWVLANQMVADFLALEDLCGAMKHARIPLRVHLTADDAGMGSLAAAVRSYMGIHEGIVFDYFELFEACGFRIVVLPLPAATDSFSYFDPLNDNAVFFIQQRKNAEKQIFSLAFELGLVYLRNSLVPGTLAAAELPHLARKFAAEFLMPAETVLRTVRQLGIGPRGWSYDLLLRIKHRFGVSAESLLYRLNELKQIDPALSEELRQRIYQHYAATNYGEPDSTRRVLTPNGRLWDLVLVAKSSLDTVAETTQIEKRLVDAKVEKR